MSTNDLQALFANLKPRSREPPSTESGDNNLPLSGTNYLPPSISSPPPFAAIGSPSADSQPQHHKINPSSGSTSATSQSLLNLLNFGSSGGVNPLGNSKPAQLSRTHSENTPVTEKSGNNSSLSASDLVGRFMTPPASIAKADNHVSLNLQDQGGGGTAENIARTEAKSNPQDALLKLLSKGQSNNTVSASDAGEKSSQPNVDTSELPYRNAPNGQASPKIVSSPSHAENHDNPQSRSSTASNIHASTTSTAHEAKDKPGTSNKSIFTYTNPFEALNASRTQTPKSSTPTPRERESRGDLEKNDTIHPSIEIQATHAGEAWSPFSPSSRKKLTPKLPSTKINVLPRDLTLQSTTTASQVNPNLDSKLETTEKLDSNTNKDDNLTPEILSEGGPENKSAHQPRVSEQAFDIQEGIADEWEDTEESPRQEEIVRKVPVFNFPIKPFVSITLHLDTTSVVGIRDDGVMEISRLKKEFDQLDRSLAAATTKFITYALVKNGGMRVIRQDDGSDRQVFKNSHDRVFNVSFCTTAVNLPQSDDQAVLGTGVSGAVYYATISKKGNDLFENDELESESLVFPPHPPADENTAGGVLKTRAKRSSRHPEFFAIGRGKSIHLIWPATAISPRYGVTDGARKVDVEKFYQERTLQISTGKAGKDFIFSEDDTLIISLDKTGRLRFWDIRKLIEEENATAPRINPVTIDTPLLSLSTASPAEKSWPTSVLFVDKSKPYLKGGALRYILVGLRQNHTLQLWDIALGKAVQELNFPHENETDGVCSVNYHPTSGIIVVGHPTRNSLFFIHLSAPKYTLSSSISQATYVERIAAKDPEMHKPDSTACMSGIREISFAEKGQLRSVELLPIHKSADTPKTYDEKSPLFELYVVHSKGVTCLNINKEDLGWNSDNKVIHPVDASKEGIVSLKELKLGSVIDETTRSKSPVEEVQQSSKKKKSTKKLGTSGLDRVEIENEAESAIINKAQPQLKVNGTESQIETLNEVHNTKDSKKAKKKNGTTNTQLVDLPPRIKSSSRTSSPSKIPDVMTQPPANSRPTVETDLNSATRSTMEPHIENDATSKPDAVTVGISGDWLDKELKKVERGVASEFRKELDNLYRNIQNDRVVQDSSAVARQEAVLRLVSTTLTNNVEKSLTRILGAQMQQVVVPAIAGSTVQAVTAQVGDVVAKSLHTMIPHEVATHLPIAVNAALSSPQMNRILTEAVSNKIAKQTEHQIADLVHKTILPAFKDLAASAAENASSAVEARLRSELQQHEADRRRDTARVEKLSQVIQGMAETLQAMSDTQLAFQGQILKDRRQIVQMGESGNVPTSRQVSTARLSPAPSLLSQSTPIKSKSKEEVELDEITQLMNEGKYEEGSIKWLQSSQPIDLFDNLFVRFTPEYLATDVSPLVAFSIAVTVGNSLVTHTLRRLEWIASAFDAVDLTDPEIADLSQHAPSLLTSLVQKLESLYMTTAERNPTDPSLKMIPLVAKRAKDMKAMLQGHGRQSMSSQGFDYP